MPYKDKEKHNENQRKHWFKHKEKHRLARLKRKELNPLFRKHESLARKLRLYKLTEEEYFGMFIEQDNKCAICLQPETIIRKETGLKPLSVDHCHKTGKTRALLCNACNVGIAQFKENTMFLNNAINYLNKFKEIQ
jgi:hypothetical protein